MVLAGFAGLAAGAFSMAVGEYTSVASQSEAAAHEIAKERREIIANPEGETHELAEMYVEKGDRPPTWRTRSPGRSTATSTTPSPSTPARSSASTRDDLASPMLAAVSSFVAFALGALVPVLPYLLGADTPAARPASSP